MNFRYIVGLGSMAAFKGWNAIVLTCMDGEWATSYLDGFLPFSVLADPLEFKKRQSYGFISSEV